MALTIPEKEVRSFVAGTTLTWKRYLADFLPADGWALSYDLVKDGANIAITSSDNGDGFHLVSVTAATTENWSPGFYSWQAFVTKTTTRHDIESGSLEVLTNFANADVGYDGRTHARKVLDALEGMIEGKALSADQLSFSIGGRSLTRLSPEELWEWRARYRSEVASEEIEADPSRGSGRHIRTRFRVA